MNSKETAEQWVDLVALRAGYAQLEGELNGNETSQTIREESSEVRCKMRSEPRLVRNSNGYDRKSSVIEVWKDLEQSSSKKAGLGGLSVPLDSPPRVVPTVSAEAPERIRSERNKFFLKGVLGDDFS